MYWPSLHASEQYSIPLSSTLMIPEAQSLTHCLLSSICLYMHEKLHQNFAICTSSFSCIAARESHPFFRHYFPYSQILSTDGWSKYDRSYT